MPVFRFSLRWLLAFVAFVAICVASLRYASYPIYGCLWAAWLLFLATALLGVIYRAERERAFWLGCCVFGWTFAAHVYLFQEKSAPLHRAIQSAYDAVSWRITVAPATAQELANEGWEVWFNGPTASVVLPLQQPFKSTLLVLGGIAAAVIGGFIAQWFHATQARKPDDGRCGSDDW